MSRKPSCAVASAKTSVGDSSATPRVLDFALLPPESQFASRTLLIGLSPSLEARLASLPQVLERVRSAVMFAELSGKQSEAWRAAAFIRAALAEFSSIEEMQELDGPSAPHFKIKDQPNPLLHILELMRHLNVHVRPVKARHESVPVSICEHTFELDIYIVSDLHASELLGLRSGRHYASADIQEAVAWFGQAQAHWGAGYVIRAGIESLALSVCDHFGL